jgi:predicted nucleic acid-binding protein
VSVLVDTSVWIRFLAAKEPYASVLNMLLEQEEVLGHEHVYGELLVGDRGGREALLSAYGQMDRAEAVPHQDVVEMVTHRRLHGRGVGWIDVHLLASSLVARARLWTADQALHELATDLGIAFAPMVEAQS